MLDLAHEMSVTTQKQFAIEGASVLPPILRQVFADKQTRNADGQPVPLHSNISEAEAEQLYAAVQALKPRHTLEVGLAQGISATAILQALADGGVGTHHVMDPFQERFENAGLAMVERAGLSGHLDFHRAYAEEVVPRLPVVEFAFIDSSHLFDLTLLEFVLVDKKLATGGVIAFHDLWMPSIQAAVRYILSNRAYQPWDLDTGHGRAQPSRRRELLAWILRQCPGAEGIFRSELLEPDISSGNNLVFLRKLQQDERDWQFHCPF